MADKKNKQEQQYLYKDDLRQKLDKIVQLKEKAKNTKKEYDKTIMEIGIVMRELGSAEQKIVLADGTKMKIVFEDKLRITKDKGDNE